MDPPNKDPMNKDPLNKDSLNKDPLNKDPMNKDPDPLNKGHNRNSGHISWSLNYL